jgi:hypothetical protein
LVLCVDEKAQVQALDRGQPLLPLRPGQAARRTHDCFRHGATSLFAALVVKSGAVIGRLHRRHRSLEFRKLLDRIEAETPAQFELQLILGNYATHKTPATKRWLLRHPRFHPHSTPKGVSWLNLAERWLGLLTEKQLRRGVHRRTRELEEAIRNHLRLYNRDPKPFVWRKTADQILESAAKFCQRLGLRTLESGFHLRVPK